MNRHTLVGAMALVAIAAIGVQAQSPIERDWA